ncbi:MAG: hypothetical protein L6V88_05840 [Anaerotruncus sp.]|nr:MAG: hypothetical protein L6V88_05840 [Anaerotruncus sp.]
MFAACRIPIGWKNLRSKTGLDKEVRDYVFSFDESKQLLDKLIDMLDFLNPLYIKEGKSQIVFAIGCTGGNHRSVAIAEALKEHFEKKWDNVSVNHRGYKQSLIKFKFLSKQKPKRRFGFLLGFGRKLNVFFSMQVKK